MARDKEKKREYDRRWYEANREHKLETKKSWYRANYQHKIYHKTCEECQTPFIGKTKRTRFCSCKCKEKNRGRIRRKDPSYRAYLAAKARQWAHKYPEKVDYKSRKHRYKKYGTTVEEVDRWVIEQNNCCLICEKPFTEDDPYVVDHCHTKIIARGLLHEKCNILVGFADDNPAILRKAAEYLERTNGG